MGCKCTSTCKVPMYLQPLIYVSLQDADRLDIVALLYSCQLPPIPVFFLFVRKRGIFLRHCENMELRPDRSFGSQENLPVK